jgi:integrase
MEEQAKSEEIQGRRMVRAALQGQHTHSSASGINVHVWRRRQSYIARGRFEGKQFGQAIGTTEAEAVVGLRHLLTALDEGRFILPSRARDLPLVTNTPSRLRLDELAALYLDEKRRLKGEQTMRDYRSRLEPLLRFALSSENQKRWPSAHQVDRSFAVEFRASLHSARTTRNGKPGARETKYSDRQIFNILETVRSMLNWAALPTVRKLPPSFVSPFTKEIVGTRGTKDPLRCQVLPIEVRTQMAARLDCWQLCALGLAMTLPLRPEELVSLLISDFDFKTHELRFGTRFEGADYTKGKQTFALPLCEELETIIIACIGDRTEGPLLCRRKIWCYEEFPRERVFSREELESYFEAALAEAGTTVQTPQDRKRVFHRFLRDLGGLSTDELRHEFKSMTAALGIKDRLYDCRHSISTDMYRAGVARLELEYMTGHTLRGIMSEYVPCNPRVEMAKYHRFAKPLYDRILSRGRELECLDDEQIRVWKYGPDVCEVEELVA